MPVIENAKKALRQSKRKAEINRPVKTRAQTLLKKARSKPTAENVSKAFSALDKAAKRNIFHANKVSRLKKSLSRQLGSSQSAK